MIAEKGGKPSPSGQGAPSMPVLDQAAKLQLISKYQSFEMHPPKVEPSEMEFEIPCLGVEEESVKFFIRNYAIDRLTFKCKGTRLDRFRLVPATGFIEAKAVQIIDVIPTKPMNDETGFRKNDHFSAVVAPAPRDDDASRARDFWKHKQAPELTLTKRFQINLKVVDKRKKLDIEEEDEGNSQTEDRSTR